MSRLPVFVMEIPAGTAAFDTVEEAGLAALRAVGAGAAWAAVRRGQDVLYRLQPRPGKPPVAVSARKKDAGRLLLVCPLCGRLLGAKKGNDEAVSPHLLPSRTAWCDG